MLTWEPFWTWYVLIRKIVSIKIASLIVRAEAWKWIGRTRRQSPITSCFFNKLSVIRRGIRRVRVSQCLRAPLVAIETVFAMDILSALRSWRSKGSKMDLSEGKGSMSPSFRRWGSVKRQSKHRQRHSSKLSVCRENQSQSLPSSVCGDSVLELDFKANFFRRDDYLDPFQGRLFYVTFIKDVLLFCQNANCLFTRRRTK